MQKCAELNLYTWASSFVHWPGGRLEYRIGAYVFYEMVMVDNLQGVKTLGGFIYRTLAIINRALVITALVKEKPTIYKMGK